MWTQPSLLDSNAIFYLRSELPARLGLDEEANESPMEDEMEKRNVASLAQSNMFPAKSHLYGKRSFDDDFAAGGKVHKTFT